MNRENNTFHIVKGKYKTFDDFKTKFDLLKCLGDIPEILKGDFEEDREKFVKKIEEDYAPGDELWHCNNTGLFVNSGQEYISLRRNSKTIKTYIIKTL